MNSSDTYDLIATYIRSKEILEEQCFNLVRALHDLYPKRYDLVPSNPSWTVDGNSPDTADIVFSWEYYSCGDTTYYDIRFPIRWLYDGKMIEEIMAIKAEDEKKSAEWMRAKEEDERKIKRAQLERLKKELGEK